MRSTVNRSLRWLTSGFFSNPVRSANGMVSRPSPPPPRGARDEIDREQVAQVADLGVLLEPGEVGERHALAQLAQALVGDAAVLHEVRVALEDGLGEQLAARDLDP